MFFSFDFGVKYNSDIFIGSFYSSYSENDAIFSVQMTEQKLTSRGCIQISPYEIVLQQARGVAKN